MMRIRTLFSGFIGIAVVMLVGCFGGGGGGGGSTPPGNITLGGTAAKGIVKGGNVVAEELDASGTVIRQVGSATTIADGSYSLTVSTTYGGGPIQVTVSADADTQMKCDVPLDCGPRSDGLPDTVDPTNINFGEWYKPGSGNLMMKALVAEAEANQTIGVSITPYTNMAASRAREAGTLDAAAVYNANSEVTNLLGGINILNIKPLDITDASAVGAGSATEVAYAAFAAAVADLAGTNAQGNPDIDGALASLSSLFSGGTVDASSLQNIIDKTDSAFTKAGVVDRSGTVAAIQTVVTAAAGGTVNLVPSTNAAAAPLVKVKAFVGDVRTWGTVIEAETRAKGDAFSQQVDLASAAADLSSQFLVGPAMGAAIDAIIMNFDGTNISTDLSTYVTGAPGDPQFTAGTIVKSGEVITITDGIIGGDTVNMSAQLPVDGSTVVTSLTIGISSASFSSAMTDADINSGTLTLNLATPYPIDWAAIDAGTADTPDISGGSFDLDVALTQKQDEFGAALAASVTFAGTLSSTLVNPIKDATTNEITWITPSTLTLSGKVSTSAGESLDATFTANITNAATFAPVGELPYGTPKANLVTWAYVGNTFTVTSPEYTLTIQWNSSTSTTVTENWTYGYYNTYDIGPHANIVEAVTSISSPLYWLGTYGFYVWVDGEGEYMVDLSGANFRVNGTASGSLEYPDFVLEADAANKWLDADVGLNFALQLAGLPEASINISGDRTGFESGDAAITIAYGTRQIVIEGSFTGTTSTAGVTITNREGVTMSLEGDLDAGTGNVMFNGHSYATITQTTSGLTKITYSDGTFEIL